LVERLSLTRPWQLGHDLVVVVPEELPKLVGGE
jgi:hypothetical protein